MCHHKMAITLPMQSLSLEYYFKQLQLLFTHIVMYLLLILVCYVFVQFMPDLLLLLLLSIMDYYCEVFP